jgi:hypothetical protein
VPIAQKLKGNTGSLTSWNWSILQGYLMRAIEDDRLHGLGQLDGHRDFDLPERHLEDGLFVTGPWALLSSFVSKDHIRVFVVCIG